VTRSADAASMTGTNFSDWYRQDEGTVYAEANIKYQSSTSIYLFSFDNGTNANRIASFVGASLNPNYYIAYNGSSQIYDTYPVSITLGEDFKHSMCYRVNDLAHSVDGGVARTDSVANIPTVNRIIFDYTSSSLKLNGTFKKFAYYPTRLTNAELQALTED